MAPRVAHRYRIQYDDDTGVFGFAPEYGDTFDEALKKVIIAKFGCDYRAYADQQKQGDAEKMARMSRAFSGKLLRSVQSLVAAPHSLIDQEPQ